MATSSSSKQAKRRKTVRLNSTIKLNNGSKKVSSSAVVQHERDLIESEKKYRELVELAHDGIMTADANDKLTFVNQQFARSLGYKIKELIGKSVLDFAAPETAKEMSRQTKLRSTGKKSRYEVILIHKNGSKKYFWLSASPRFDENKNFLGSLGVYSDVTEKKHAERNLEKKVKQINALYKVYSHARMARSVGTVFRGIVNELISVLPDSDCAQVRIEFDGRIYTSAKKLKPFVHKVEVPLIIAGIQRGRMEVGYANKLPNLTMRDERILCKNVADILCKHMNARELMGRHKEIVNKAFTALIIVREGKINYANPRFFSLFKVREKDSAGAEISDFLPNCCPNAKNADGRVRECHGMRPDGSRLEVAVTMLKIVYEGKQSFLVRVNDITALKHAQSKLKTFNRELKTQVKEKTRHLEKANRRLKSLNDLKDEFIAITSHELRSPLTSVRGYLSLLIEDEALADLSEPYKDYLIKAYNNADSLNYLVNNLLDASRIDMDRFTLQKRSIDLIKLISQIAESLEFHACDNKLKLEFINETGQEEVRLMIDEIRMSQVLRNIIDNAIKFTKQGKNIYVRLSKKRNFYRIGVVDQGVGIPKAKLDEVFDKFMQVKNIQTKYKGGAGLGLFISKRIVELHGGRIEAGRNSYGGTTISIDLPITPKTHAKNK